MLTFNCIRYSTLLQVHLGGSMNSTLRKLLSHWIFLINHTYVLIKTKFQQKPIKLGVPFENGGQIFFFFFFCFPKKSCNQYRPHFFFKKITTSAQAITQTNTSRKYFGAKMPNQKNEMLGTMVSPYAVKCKCRCKNIYFKDVDSRIVNMYTKNYAKAIEVKLSFQFSFLSFYNL